MRALQKYFLFLLILTACKNGNTLNEIEKFDTTSLLISLTINDSIADTNIIDNYFRISTFYKGEKLSFYPSTGKITLPIFDTIPDFSIEFKDLKTEFIGDMPKYEGQNIFTKRASEINLIIDTYPFDSISISKFRNREITENNYFMFIETNSNGWNFNALEIK